MAVKLADITLDLNADCAEFCPAPHNQHILAAGTYQLDEATNTRHGRMYLYDVSEVSVQPLDWPAPAMPGIFDLKWMNTSDHASSLALALADGTVHIHALQQVRGVRRDTLQCCRSHCTDASPAGCFAVQEGEDARASGIAEVSSCRASDDAMCLMVEASHQPSLSSSSSPLSTMSGSALVVSNSSGTLSLIQVGQGETFC